MKHTDTRDVEDYIAEWRSRVATRQPAPAVAALEDTLRAEFASLSAAGLETDEAFLIALTRSRGHSPLTRHVWKALLSDDADAGSGRQAVRRDGVVAICLAVAAAVAIKVPALFGLDLQRDGDVYARNAAVFVLPFLASYFIWKRRVSARVVGLIATPFVLAAIFANVYPFVRQGSTEVLSGIHVAIALWLTVGVAYSGARWTTVHGRMDFIRFSGELFIHYVLIALGGGVLTAFMAMIFAAIGLNPEIFFQSWLMPCGAAGAVLIASWLVESRQGIAENIAPMLARIFTPLFAALMLAFIAAVLWTGRGVSIEREVLIAFDLLLAVVLALLLYSLSARDPDAPRGAFDVLQVVLLVSALIVDAVALSAIVGRISTFGFSANRVAALGENVILLVNLVWAAVLQIRFLRGRAQLATLERWQTSYLPVYAVWAMAVIIAFPPLFRYT
jgi:hypothetical protein